VEDPKAPAGSTPQGLPDLAAKIDHLFTTVFPAGRGPYTYKEVAEGIEKVTGEPVSDTTLWKLRTGKANNPTKRIIEGLAAFFGVNPAYFFDDETARQVGDEIRLLALLRDSGVRGAQLRSFVDLSPEARDMIAQLIKSTAELERRHAQRARSAGAAKRD
jgi:transcriptional regulator with XRE-family HTH domain